MNTKHTRRAAAAIAVVLGCLGFLAAPASAATETGTIVPPSEIVLHGNFSGDHLFELGAPPTTPPPASCGLPTTWTPSTIDFDIASGTVTTNFDFEPGYAPIALLGDYRAEISGSGSGTITPTSATTAEVSIDLDGTVDLQECVPGFPSCVVTYTGTLAGEIFDYPPVQAGLTTAHVWGTVTLDATACGGLFDADLTGATADIDLWIDF